MLDPANLPKDELARLIKQVEKEMKDAAKAHDALTGKQTTGATILIP